ncbi:hypothetical protein ACLMAB_23935 [Brevibacillus laterosporus]
MWKNGFTHRLMSVATATALLFTSGIMPTQAFAAKEGMLLFRYLLLLI